MAATLWAELPAETEVISPAETDRLISEFVAEVHELGAQQYPELFQALSENGRRLFVVDFLKALLASEAGDEDAVERAVESWTRTMRLRTNPRYGEGIAQLGTGQEFAPEELRTALGI